MQIRVPDAADAPAMAEVHVRGWQVGCAGVLPDAYLDGLDLAASEARWRGKAANPHPATEDLVAEADGRVVALASFGRSYDPDLPLNPPADRPVRIAELHLLYVLPSHWGTGVGPRLHDAALTTLADRGFTAARLWVVLGNERALRFYGRQGWRRDGVTRTVTDEGVSWTELRLVRPIDAG